MSKWTRIALAGLLLTALSGLAWLLVSSQGAEEPVYEGRPLSEWLPAFDSNNGDQPGVSRRDARRAVRVAGTNAIPTLLRLRAADSPSRLKLIELLRKQHFIKFRFRTAADLHNEAMAAFQELGIRAAVAAPELIKMYDEVPALSSRNEIAYVLEGMGPAAQAAVPSLQRQLANTNQSVANAARNVLDNINRGRGQIRGWPDLYFIPLHWRGSGSFAEGPGDMPKLLEMLKSAGADGYWARFVLEQLDPDAAARVITNDDKAVDFAKPASPDSSPGNHASLLSVGEWSETVRDSRGGLRGRLLVYETSRGTNRHGEWWGDTPVEMELQDITGAIVPVPSAVYFDPGNGFEAELRDAQGNPVPRADGSGPIAPGFWVTAPFDGEVRFRVDSSSVASQAKAGGLTLRLGRQTWRIGRDDTNEYFLSATSTSPTNHIHPLDCSVWGGTIKLPPVRIAFH